VTTTNVDAINQVLSDLALAGKALKALPPERINSAVTFWVEVLHTKNEAYGWDSATIPTLRGATSEEISALDRTLIRLFKISESNRRLVMARAMGLSWRKIMKYRRLRGEGVRHSNLKIIFRNCIYEMAGVDTRETV